jgi:hypothetical protein
VDGPVVIRVTSADLMPFLPTSLMGRPRTIVTSLETHDRLGSIVCRLPASRGSARQVG